MNETRRVNEPDRFFVILAFGGSEFERGQFHQLIKTSALQWWHQFPDVWIVAGGSAFSWRDSLAEISTETGAQILVLELTGTWGGWGQKEPFDWLNNLLATDQEPQLLSTRTRQLPQKK